MFSDLNLHFISRYSAIIFITRGALFWFFNLEHKSIATRQIEYKFINYIYI